MIAEVIIDISNDGVDRVFDYNAADNIKIGSRVLVKFLNGSVQGYVIGLKEVSSYAGKLKDIIDVLDDEIISGELLRLMDCMTEKYNLRRIDVLRLFLAPSMREGRVGELRRKFVTLNNALSEEDIQKKIGARSKDKAAAVIDLLRGGGDYLSNLKALYGSVIDTLIKKEVFKVDEKAVRRQPVFMTGNEAGAVDATDDQKKCLEAIAKGGRFLLHGVTGSGKTEVYMRVIENALSVGKTAVMLVPEIALTAQLYRLFKSRFRDNVAVLHSGLSAGERFDEWMRILNGEATVVIGARSAIFAPLKNIGAVIIDEEHDGSYVSETNPRYDARFVAEFRAEHNDAVFIMGSATPSVETYYRIRRGELKLLVMPNRINKRRLPDIEIVDMCTELRRGNNGIFSAQLEQAIREELERGNQIMIYLNRRGHSSFVMCRACGYIAKCSDCDISLTYHSVENRLKCHYCGKKFQMLDNCPDCGSPNLRYGKIGTERVMSELSERFQNARILRMDNDTTKEKGGHEKILSEFYNRKADILVGTQMIAKGHDFPDVTLVGILDADMSLYFSDYRSNERTFQLMTQVAGRSGREKKSGRVILQTYAARHHVFKYAGGYDYNGFFEKEINSREVTKYPPFTVILRVLASSPDDESAMAATREIYKNIKRYQELAPNSFVYLNAMRSPVTRIQNKYRYQVLMRIMNDEKTDEAIKAVYKAAEIDQKKDTVIFTEINPQSLV